MFKYVELCVEMRRGRHAKDGLIQYRGICQQSKEAEGVRVADATNDDGDGLVRPGGSGQGCFNGGGSENGVKGHSAPAKDKEGYFHEEVQVPEEPEQPLKSANLGFDLCGNKVHFWSASATSRALPSTPRAGKPSDHCRGSMRRCILHHVHRPSGVPFMTLVESGVPIETTFYVHALSRATF
ncbi:eukaryotic translation initiation factor 3 subunit A [Striga asiatica]|uniref:Eukaryotic translation initiation factor 3 subunit A n=1 Tax=Striga asiatica TaxID=4170 RepID=A0A5A7RIH9_STRAF|nr:eukaryotic translation initiation factor 3 subunit A [Striga asiatica]